MNTFEIEVIEVRTFRWVPFPGDYGDKVDTSTAEGMIKADVRAYATESYDLTELASTDNHPSGDPEETKTTWWLVEKSSTGRELKRTEYKWEPSVGVPNDGQAVTGETRYAEPTEVTDLPPGSNGDLLQDYS